MDMVYYECPPGLHLLHCLQSVAVTFDLYDLWPLLYCCPRFDECVEGGESGLLDMLPVMEQLRTDQPQHFSTMARVPATFTKTNYEKLAIILINSTVMIL